MKINFSIQMSEIEKKHWRRAIKITVVAFLLQFGFLALLNFHPGVQYRCCPPFGELQFWGGIWHWMDAIIMTFTTLCAEVVLGLTVLNGLKWSIYSMGLLYILSLAYTSLQAKVFENEPTLFQIFFGGTTLFVLATMLSFLIFACKKGVLYVRRLKLEDPL